MAPSSSAPSASVPVTPRTAISAPERLRRIGMCMRRALPWLRVNPRPITRGFNQIPFGTTGRPGLSAGDYSSPCLQ